MFLYKNRNDSIYIYVHIIHSQFNYKTGDCNLPQNTENSLLNPKLQMATLFPAASVCTKRYLYRHKYREMLITLGRYHHSQRKHHINASAYFLNPSHPLKTYGRVISGQRNFLFASQFPIFRNNKKIRCKNIARYRSSISGLARR